MFRSTKLSISPKVLIALHCVIAAIFSVMALVFAVDMAQFTGTSAPLIPETRFDVFALGTASLLVLSAITGLDALQTFDKWRTGA